MSMLGDGAIRSHAGALITCSGAISVTCCERRDANIWSVTPGVAVNWWRQTVAPAYSGADPRTERVHVDGSGRVLVGGNRGDLGHMPGNLLMYDSAGTLLWSILDDVYSLSPCSIDSAGNSYHRARLDGVTSAANVLTSRDVAGVERWTFTGFPGVADVYHYAPTSRVYTVLDSGGAGGGRTIRWHDDSAGTFIGQSGGSTQGGFPNFTMLDGLNQVDSPFGGAVRINDALTGNFLAEYTLGPDAAINHMVQRVGTVWYRTARIMSSSHIVVSAHPTAASTTELWRTQVGLDVLGNQLARMVVVDGSVYVAGHRWNDASVWQLDATTGAVQWSYDTGGDAYDVTATAAGVVLIAGALSDDWSATP